MKRQTVESKTAGAILQMPEEVTIGRKSYSVPPPSIATLILASEAISGLPAVRLDTKNVILECLYVARDCRVLGEVMATIILGAKNLKGTRKVVEKRWWGLFRKQREMEVDKREELAREILEEMSPEQMSGLMARMLGGLQPAFFLGITTSLIEVNLLRRTRTETTASGPQ